MSAPAAAPDDAEGASLYAIRRGSAHRSGRAKAKTVSRLLRLVHGGIRRLEQSIDVLAVPRKHCNADARPDLDFSMLRIAGRETRAQGIDDLSGDDCRILRTRDPGQDDGKFIAADARDGVGFAHPRLDPGGRAL